MRALLCPLLLLSACTGGPTAREVDEDLYIWLNGHVLGINSSILSQDRNSVLREIEAIRRHITPRLELLMRDAVTSDALRRRSLACFGLGFSDEPRSLGILLGALKDPAPGVRFMAMSSVGLLVFRKIILTSDVPADRLADMIRSKITDDVSATLFALECLVSEGSDMGLIGDIHTLISNHPDTGVRIEAVRVAGLIRNPMSFDPVRALVRHPEWLMRANVAIALARIGGEKAVPDLVQLMASDPDAKVREAAAAQVGQVAKFGLANRCAECGWTQDDAGKCPKCGKPLVPCAKPAPK